MTAQQTSALVAQATTSNESINAFSSIQAFEEGFYTLDKVNKNSNNEIVDLNKGFSFKLKDGNIAICILDELKANPMSGNYSFFGIFIIFFSVFSISYTPTFI